MPNNRYSLRPWLIAARPIAHGMIALPLLWGQGLALVSNAQFDWLWFAMIHLFGVGIQIYSLYLNDYADEATDRLNQSYWLSGGSRVIPDGQLSGRQLYFASLVVVFGLFLLSAVAYQYGRNAMPALTCLAAFLGWSYSLAPIKSSYQGYGELHQAISCGVVLPVIAFYMQSGSLANFPWLLLFPTGLLFFAGNIVTALPDQASDAQSNKQSYPVRHGHGQAQHDAIIMLVIAYALGVLLYAPWSDSWLGTFVIFAPAFLLLLPAQRAKQARAQDAIKSSVGSNDLDKRFILLLTLSQAWVMTLWTGWLFWDGVTAL